jgi:hypothetical protein
MKPAPAPAPRFLATLVRGKTYLLRDLKFVAGEPVEIDDQTRAHLAEHAVEVKTIPAPEGDDAEHRLVAKFKFQEIVT